MNLENIKNRKIEQEIYELLFFEKLINFMGDKSILRKEEVMTLRDFYRQNIYESIQEIYQYSNQSPQKQYEERDKI